jgi:hypothetical protein
MPIAAKITLPFYTGELSANCDMPQRLAWGSAIQAGQCQRFALFKQFMDVLREYAGERF